MAPNGAQIEVPEGALSADTAMTIIVEPAAPLPAVLQAVGTPYTFGPEGLTFAKPVKITLPWEGAKLAAGKTAAEIVMFTAPKDTSDFVPLISVVAGSSVTAETLHLSTFVPATLECFVACAAEPGSLDGASCNCSSTCLGVAYSMACSSGRCTCQNGTTTTTNCTDITNTAVTFRRACGFPGAIPAEETPDAGSDGGPPCPVACAAEGDGGCACSTTCDVASYRMDCTADGCSCKKDGQQTTTTPSVSCADSAVTCQAFVAGCSFPGSCIAPN